MKLRPPSPPRYLTRPHLAYETRVRAALRVGRYKILTNTPWCPSVAPSEGALSGMSCGDAGASWLFDVEADAAEATDLREARARAPARILSVCVCISLSLSRG